MIPQLIDQVEQGLSRNIDFLDKENFNKLLQLFLEEVQEIEVATLSIADQKNVNTAIGIWLDYIGSIVGEVRKGRSDSDYRLALLLKIAVNSSDGTPNVIIDLTKQYSGTTSSKIIDYFPAYFFNVLTLPEGASTVGLSKLVDSIKPAGVGATVVNNIEGNRFVPSWVTSNYYLETYTLELTSGGVTDQIEINGVDTLAVDRPAYDQIHTEYAYLDWTKLEGFDLFTGGTLSPMTFHNGDPFEVAKGAGTSSTASEGLLAQVIIN